MMTNNEYTYSMEYYGEPKVYVQEEEDVMSMLHKLAREFEEDTEAYLGQEEDEEEMAQWYEFDAYQDWTDETAIYPPEQGLEYTALGLASEAGEFAGKVKKMIRDKNYDLDAMASELGDVLWYVARAAAELDIHLSDVAQMNIEKLQSRKERSTLKGSGDDR
jgi:NTP pyrophosphatase (non-canonical NTP hydrolase)